MVALWGVGQTNSSPSLPVVAGSHTLKPFWKLIISRQAQWIVTLGLLGSFLELSWLHVWFMSSSKSFFLIFLEALGDEFGLHN